MIKIFTTETDEAIEKMNIDIDRLMEQFFTVEEREELIVQRISNLISPSVADILESLFEDYFSEYSISYLNGDFETKEEFAAKYLDKLVNLNPNYNKLDHCNWSPANCGRISVCPSRDYDVTYYTNECATKEIVNHNCRKTTGERDCDNAYYWNATKSEYINTSNHNFIWYTANPTYRVLMDTEVGGFQVDGARQYSTFMGIQHGLAIFITWFSTSCKHDAWIDITRFGAIANNEVCIEPAIERN